MNVFPEDLPKGPSHGRPRTNSLPGRQDPLDPRAGEDDRHGRRFAELEPAELLRDEIPAGQRLPRHPGQSGDRRRGAAGRDASTPRCATSPTRSTWSTCSAPRTQAPASSTMPSRSAPRWSGCSSASATTRRRAKAEAAGIEVIMNRCPKIEFGRLGGELSWSGVNTGIIRNRAAGSRRLPRRLKPRPPPASNIEYGFETRAIHAGAAPDPTTGARITPIYQTTAYVFDDVDHAASLFNLHNFGYIYSRLTNPTVSVLEERIASLEGGRAAVAAGVGPRRAVPGVLHDAGAGRRVPGLARALRRLADAVRAVVQEARLDLPFRRSGRPGEFPPRADAEVQGDLRRKPGQSGRRRRRHRARSPRSRTRPACR